MIDYSRFFDEPLENIENLIKTNVHPYVLLAKYATIHFRQNKDKHDHKVGLIQTSSSLADMMISPMATYGATKAFNKVFANLLAKQFERTDAT